MDFYLDTNNLRTVAPKRMNSAHSIVVSNERIEIAGISTEYKTTSFVALLDSRNRFVVGARVQSDGKWNLQLPLDRIARDRGALNCRLYVVKKDSNTAVPVDMTSKLREQLNRSLASFLPQDAQDIPSFRNRYIDLIIKATKHKYVATSIHRGIKTGNNYQSVDLGDILRMGTRPLRVRLLDRIRFQDASVLDLGCNTGEISRYIRRLGARLVDGYEYDPFFVETGRAINAALGATRVSVFQGDITNPKLYKKLRYDIVVALSVYPYIVNQLPEIAEVTNILVLETHTLDHGLDFYFRNLLPHFPVARHLGYSEENNEDPRKSRAFLVFATSTNHMLKCISEEFLIVKPYFRNPFIEKHGTVDRAEFIKFCKNLKFSAFNPQQEENESIGFGSIEYYTQLLVGYLEYLEANRTVKPTNPFLQIYRKAIEDEKIDDPALTQLLQDNNDPLIAKVRNKFVDIDFFFNNSLNLVPPVRLKLAAGGGFKFTNTDNQVFKCQNIDGHHRFFLAQLFGCQTLSYTLLPEADTKDRRESIKSNYPLMY